MHTGQNDSNTSTAYKDRPCKSVLREVREFFAGYMLAEALVPGDVHFEEDGQERDRMHRRVCAAVQERPWSESRTTHPSL